MHALALLSVLLVGCALPRGPALPPTEGFSQAGFVCLVHPTFCGQPNTAHAFVRPLVSRITDGDHAFLWAAPERGDLVGRLVTPSLFLTDEKKVR
jgi:hypothetical protein